MSSGRILFVQNKVRRKICQSRPTGRQDPGGRQGWRHGGEGEGERGRETGLERKREGKKEREREGQRDRDRETESINVNINMAESQAATEFLDISDRNKDCAMTLFFLSFVFLNNLQC